MTLIEQVRKLGNARAALLNQLTRELYQLINDTSTELYQDIIRRYLLKELALTEDGKLKNTVGNYASTAQLDKIFNKTFQRDAREKIIKQIISGSQQVNRINSRYFGLFDAEAVQDLSSAIEKKILANYGITPGGKFIGEGVLNDVFTSTEPLNKIKNLIHGAIASEAAIMDLEGSLKSSIIDEGLLTRYLDNTQITNVHDRYDRQTTREYSTALGLDYAIYQGGIIDDSRDFCVERNGKVFTREEIQLFGTSQDTYGGYTNKSAGEFKGKFKPSTKVYDPETDLGGYNCRHHLGWITYELAVQLRPDLKKAA